MIVPFPLTCNTDTSYKYTASLAYSPDMYLDWNPITMPCTTSCPRGWKEHMPFVLQHSPVVLLAQTWVRERERKRGSTLQLLPYYPQVGMSRGRGNPWGLGVRVCKGRGGGLDFHTPDPSSPKNNQNSFISLDKLIRSCKECFKFNLQAIQVKLMLLINIKIIIF